MRSNALEAAAITEADVAAALRDTDAVAARVRELMDLASSGALPTPPQCNGLHRGLYVLAQARRTDMLAPLLAFLRSDGDMLDECLGDALSESCAEWIASFFAGDADPIYDLAADPGVDGMVRWSALTFLSVAAARGKLDRAGLVAFLDRFERQGLAVSGDPAWNGWAEAVSTVNAQDLAERARAAAADGRWVELPGEHAEHLRAMREDRIATSEELDELNADPIESAFARIEAWLPGADDEEEEAEAFDDPAKDFALTEEELTWFEAFRSSRHCPFNAANIEMLDAFLCGLAARADVTELRAYIPILWAGGVEDAVEPEWSGPEQRAYVYDLIDRHWRSIRVRLEAGIPHAPVIDIPEARKEGAIWATGLLLSQIVEPPQVDALMEHKGPRDVVTMLQVLAGEPFYDGPLSENERLRLLQAIPDAVTTLFNQYRGEQTQLFAPPRIGKKVGRNEACPCGSGKKYKQCCIAA
jgi:uncharacterized protein